MANNSPIPPRQTQDDDLALSTLVARLSVAVVLMLMIVVALGMTVREPLVQISQWFVAKFGLMGVFAACFGLDAIPFTTHEPILFFAYSGGLGFWVIFLAASTGSVASGSLGWLIGQALGAHPRVKRMLLRYKVTPFLHKYGVWAIAVAAITPFPFAISTWGAGATGVPWKQVLLGSLFRIPKVLFYLSLIAAGWNVTG